MVYYLFCLFEVCYSSHQLVYLGICLLHLEGQSKFLHVGNVVQQVVYIHMLLVDHFGHSVFEIGSLLLDSVPLGFDFIWKRKKYFGSFMKRLIIFLCEGMFDKIQKFEPIFDGLKLIFIFLFQLFFDFQYIFL